MSQEALIKVRCSTKLKKRLTALADKREQTFSDYVRQALIDYADQEEAVATLAEPAKNPAKKK